MDSSPPVRTVRSRGSFRMALLVCLLLLMIVMPRHGQCTYVVFTIDVCWTCGTDFQGAFQGKEYGVPLIAKMLEDHGFRGTFFFNPYYSPGKEQAMQSNLRFILSRGHDVQLHTHTDTFDLSRGLLTLYSREEKDNIIRVGIENLLKAGAPRPIAHRSGGFAVDDETLELLSEHGIRIDSSIFPLWSSSKIDLPEARMNSVFRLGRLLEVPVTLTRLVPFVGCAGMTPLSLDTTIWEQHEEALNQAARRGLPVVTLFFHYHTLYTCTESGIPYEPLHPTGPNQENIDALEKVLAMLSRDGRFRVVTMKDLWEVYQKDPAGLEQPGFVPYTGLYLTYLKAWRHFHGHHGVMNKLVALAPVGAAMLLLGVCVYAATSRKRAKKGHSSSERN